MLGSHNSRFVIQSSWPGQQRLLDGSHGPESSGSPSGMLEIVSVIRSDKILKETSDCSYHNCVGRNDFRCEEARVT